MQPAVPHGTARCKCAEPLRNLHVQEASNEQSEEEIPGNINFLLCIYHDFHMSTIDKFSYNLKRDISYPNTPIFVCSLYTVFQFGDSEGFLHHFLGKKKLVFHKCSHTMKKRSPTSTFNMKQTPQTSSYLLVKSIIVFLNSVICKRHQCYQNPRQERHHRCHRRKG